MTIAYASMPFEPREAQPLGLAAQWLAQAVTGSAVVTLCVLAIATVGLLALQGRLPVRRGAYVVLGCFVVLGAPVIASALMDLAHGADAVSPSPGFTDAPPQMRSLPPANYDPYAGASLRRD